MPGDQQTKKRTIGVKKRKSEKERKLVEEKGRKLSKKSASCSRRATEHGATRHNLYGKGI